jgi:hypothetical protein
MRVFISWSGEPSRSVARALHGWLPRVVQHLEHGCPTKISKAALFGIVCVTAANQHAPWLIFEAGALAKHLEAARVMPLCIDLEPAAVTGALGGIPGKEARQRRSSRPGPGP